MCHGPDMELVQQTGDSKGLWSSLGTRRGNVGVETNKTVPNNHSGNSDTNIKNYTCALQ